MKDVFEREWQFQGLKVWFFRMNSFKLQKIAKSRRIKGLISMRAKITIISFLALTVCGCTTMSADECLTANWQAIGYVDGSRGYSFDRVRRRQSACAEHGVSAKLNDYRSGYDKGIRVYCTPELGYSLAKFNKSFPKVCPADTVNAVHDGYKLGKIIYIKKTEFSREIESLEGDIQAIDDQITGLVSERNEHEGYLQMAEDSLKKPAIKDSERLIVYTERAELRRLVQETDEKIGLLEKDKERHQALINEIQHKIQELNNKAMPGSK